jgi:hypothetical protein
VFIIKSVTRQTEAWNLIRWEVEAEAMEITETLVLQCINLGLLYLFTVLSVLKVDHGLLLSKADTDCGFMRLEKFQMQRQLKQWRIFTGRSTQLMVLRISNSQSITLFQGL